MDLMKLKELFENFNFSALLPKLDSVLGWADLFLRVPVMAGPLALLGFGLLYWLAPASEANYGYGYRLWWGMSSLESWRFTQRLAGLVFTALGLIMTVVFALVSLSFRDLEPMELAGKGIVCLLWELGFAALARLGIDITVLCLFDRKGYRRGKAPL